MRNWLLFDNIFSVCVYLKNMNIESKIKELFESGAHFAFSRTRRHSSAKPFIFGVKNQVEIFDLEKTAEYLEKAKQFVHQLASQNKKILFVGTKNEAQDIIKEEANKVEVPYVEYRWIGGTITNFPEIRKRVEMMEDLIKQKEKGELSKYTKKERLLLDKKIEKLQKMFSGLSSLKALPDALFVIDSRKEVTAVAEAKNKSIPIISLSGSDCNMKEVDFPIPANDTSVSSIQFFVKQIAEAYSEGKKEAGEKKEQD